MYEDHFSYSDHDQCRELIWPRNYNHLNCTLQSIRSYFRFAPLHSSNSTYGWLTSSTGTSTITTTNDDVHADDTHYINAVYDAFIDHEQSDAF